MFRNLTDRAKAAVFYALALTMALALAVPAPMFGELTPLIAVLLMLLVVTRDGYTRSGWAALGLDRKSVV